MITRGLAAWLLAIGLLTSTAYAHGGVDVVDNRCVLQIGPNIMFFTASQPQNSRDEFCDDIPSTGQTVVALDMEDTELRDMLTEIRIIRDDETHTRVNGLPVLTDAELASKEVLRSRHHQLSAAKEISDGHADLRKYLHREREIHRYRDGAKRTGRDLCLPVPICGGSTVWQKHWDLRHDARGTHRCGLRSLAIQPEADARCYPGIMGG